MEEGDLSESLLPLEELAEEEKLSCRLWAESKKLWIVAGPAIFMRFSTMGVLVTTQAIVGHVGPTELAGYALAFTVFDRFAVSILLGMASALETLCGQAYGAKQHHMLGIYLQRSWLILFGCVILLLPIFLYATPLLRLLGQEESISKAAGTISLWFIPIIFSHIFNFTFQMYLQSQSRNMVVTYFAVISVALHLFLSWLLVFKLSMGVAGAMSSMILAMWIPVFGQFAFVIGGGCPETWKGFSWSAFTDLWIVVKLSLSSGAMIWLLTFKLMTSRKTISDTISDNQFTEKLKRLDSGPTIYIMTLTILSLELWYNTVLVLLTGYMKDAETAIDALSICLNISGWEIMISVGFLAAAGVRVANELGAGNAKAAKFSIIVVVATSLAIGVVLLAVFLGLKGSIGYIFTDSREVADAIGDLSTLLAFTILLNSVQPVLSGVAVGAGWQSLVAYVNIASYYLIGIPLGIVLGYVIDYQVKGIWIGMMVGTLIQTVVLTLITWRMDWDKQVELAQERVNKWFLPETEKSNLG
ncbi:protein DETOXIFICATION 20-like isoform X1 [Typha latifolia]|uniref:protein DETOXIFICATION 20-like isoform X1 n=1 Tax=Typha latifolia TaxID=4733 RepID=UPI003C30DA73